MHDLETLDDYLSRYGELLGQQAQKCLKPLHIPERDKPCDVPLLRTPFEPQAHVIEAARKTLDRQRAILVCGEMGTGKTLMGQAAIHAHARGRAYRALVFAPGQLVNKWKRELQETIPGATVQILEKWRNVVRLHAIKDTAPQGPEWFVIARDTAKLGAKWKPAYNWPQGQPLPRCPSCGRQIMDKDDLPIPITELAKKRMRCIAEDENGVICDQPLWQYHGELQRWEPAKFIHKKLKHFFDYLVVDEAHECKSGETAQGNAIGALSAACSKTVAMTGTLIGGYAEHIRPLLFRLSPQSLVAEGFDWSNSMPFNECYGRIETRITEREGSGGDDNRMSRGSSRTKTKYVRPGIMPTLFGRHLIGNTVFLGLQEISDELPVLNEEVLPIEMDEPLAGSYGELQEDLLSAIKEMCRKGDKRLLGTMLQVLLAYPDYPFEWSTVGYWDKGDTGSFIGVHDPANLSPEHVYPKEKALLDYVLAERAQNRQVWVYVQFTDKRDVLSRLEKMFTRAGLRAKSLRSTVPLAKREEWIAKNGPGADVVISHPKLVETGLDLFDKHGGHNFSTLVFYETGYNLFTLRQAARRSWRIGQRHECEVAYFYYKDTLQERAMELMGKKLSAAHAIEGKFSSEGLAAMAGEDGSVELALAKGLSERIKGVDAQRHWAKVGAKAKPVILSFPNHAARMPNSNKSAVEVLDELTELLKLFE